MLTNNLVFILAVLGLFQALFICFYLFTLNKGNRTSNIFLALILLGLTVRVGKSAIGYYIPLEAWQRNIGISGALISGPCLWFYGISLLEKKNKLFSPAYYLHLLPFVLFVLLIPVIPSKGEFEHFWNYGFVVFHLAVYLILSWIYLARNYQKASGNILYWYRNIIIGSTLIWLYYVSNLLNVGLHYITGPIFYSFLIYAFSYLFLNRHNFTLEKYSSSVLDRHSSRDLFLKISKLFTDEQMFLTPNISVQRIANHLKISPRLVSQVINENDEQNFNEFVNQFRIEKAKTMLADLGNADKKIATIAYDTGFGTVTSFNIAFKKRTGVTPSEYRKQETQGNLSL